MDVALSHLSRWFWSGKYQVPRISNGSSVKSSTDFGMWESDVLRFPSVKQTSSPSSSRRVTHKWCSWEEQKIDREYDVVIVPSDVGYVSDSESDVSDWSIGWLEPHGAGFLNDEDDGREKDKSFAVLVPCYGRGYGGMVEEGPKSNLLSNVGNFPEEGKKYVENWISSLRNT